MCPLKDHPDWNSAPCEFKDSKAAKIIADQKTLHINSKARLEKHLRDAYEPPKPIL
jgi:hypothetical protein